MREFDPRKEHPATGLRILTDDEIAYHHIGDRAKLGVNVPGLLRSPLLRIIAKLPKSGIQVVNPIRYQQVHLERNASQAMRFGVMFTENFPGWAEQIDSEPALLHVFLWHTMDDRAIGALKTITEPYLVLPAGSDIRDKLIACGIAAAHLPEDEAVVVAEIAARIRGVMKMSDADVFEAKKVATDLADAFFRDIHPPAGIPFAPLRVNLDQLSQIFGRFEGNLWQELPNDFNLRGPGLAASFTAVQRALQIVSGFESEGRDFSEVRPAAVIAFPSINPRLKEDISRGLAELPPDQRAVARDLLAARVAEQDTVSYENRMEYRSDVQIETLFRLGSHDLAAYTRFFDVAGFLHASFGAAPYLRAPVKGQSLAQQHSFFSPFSLRQGADDHALRKRVYTFGDALGSALHPDLIKAIREYDGGMVVLSDLPIEWMRDEGVPLGFSKDVCRIPEGVITNLLSQFARNRQCSYEITASTAARTLVVCGANPSDVISQSFEVLREMQREDGAEAPWRMERCECLDQLYGIVNEFRPEFLIIDSHGRYVENEMGTELQFGRDYLSGRNVLDHLPQIPLVLLSACWGAPLYGCSNTIAHAFFETGSFAVTTPLLPINIVKGGVLYRRLLRNLKAAAEKPFHSNWSSLMSHTIRTSYLTDLNARAIGQFGQERHIPDEEYVTRQTAWFMKTMQPSLRVEAFREAYDVVAGCFLPAMRGEVKRLLDLGSYLPEFMFYSTMGRADLVQFDSWNRAHHEIAPTSILVKDLLQAVSERR